MAARRSMMAGALVVAFLAWGLPMLPHGTVSAAGEAAQLPTADPANFTPNVLDGEVDSIWQVGNTVIIGGTFSQVANATQNGGQVFNRDSLAALDATTGLVDTSFAPDLDGAVTTVISAGDGTSVYIAGDFNTVNGVTRRKVARVVLSDGSLEPTFNAGGVDGVVRDMRLVGATLFVGGLFTTVGSLGRSNLASLDPTTGAPTPQLDLAVAGTWNGGSTNVIKMEVTPAGDRMAVIGNFTSVEGRTRNQIALLDLTTDPVTVSDWDTDFYTSDCGNAFETYMRDVDIDENGAFAVVSTTGGYSADGSCDTIARFELGDESPSVDHTWVNYTGGDTFYAAEIHNGVVFVGGHMRWANNTASGRAGAGAVPRQGMMALDVVTGLPFSWNPGRDRGVGLFDYHVTAAGVWAGSDTDRWNNEVRQKLAFFPWSGGSSVPANTTGTLPNNIVLLGRTTGTTGADSSVLHRVNAGGPALAAPDDGPDWSADTGTTSPYRNSGSTSSSTSLTVGTYDGTMPTSDVDRPPAALWNTERWDPAGGNEMSWAFPVAAGTPIEVRLYLGNKSPNTQDVGDRVFDIDLDGVNVAADIDLAQTPGHNIGTMLSFDTVSDGTVNLFFRHVVENPLVNGIEIIRRNVSLAGSLGQQDQTRTVVGYDGVIAPTVPGYVAGTVPWRTVRGSFLVNDQLFTLHNDGTLVRRTFDGTTFGTGTAMYTYANGIVGEANSMTGIFFDAATSRVVYTLAGQNVVYTRAFLPENGVFGAIRTNITGTVAALNPARVRGMFLHGGRIWFGDNATGNLLTIGFDGTSVTGSPVVVNNTVDWRARAMFLSAEIDPNSAPAAAFTTDCTFGSCTVDASASTDSDGTIVGHAWDFGDGGTATGVLAGHSYAASGTYTVELTVTDDGGATAVTQQQVAVTVPPGGGGTGYVSLPSPARLLDTRADGTTVDMQFARQGIRPGGSTLAVTVAGRAGTPTDAASVVLNVTVTEGQEPGYLTVFPCGSTQPTASNLNFVAGQTIANLVIAKVGADGAICVFNNTATHVVVDVAGYFPGLDVLTPLPTPARLLDTRADGSTIDGASLGGGVRPTASTQVLQVTGRAGVPAGVASVVLNVTVDQAQAPGFVTVHACDAAQPTASNLNFVTGQTIANAVVAKVAADGTVCLFTSAPTHLVVDVSGWFTDASVVVPLPAPARVLDTRADGSTIDGQALGAGLRPSGGTLQLAIAGRADVPADATAVVLNVTVDQSVAAGFVTVYPPDGGRPNASNLNYVAGQTIPNAVVARLGSGGTVCLFNSGATQLVVDVAAYIVGPPPSAAGLACPPDP